ncbi:Kinesin-like protein kif14 [Clonorchis sinensis]|uniref:Kinesin-like protein n=1 Tax=Clonorchis sinensis TaxID=79923 RepID=A0A8T1MFQ5_CLOSI|nr:Kinesin-like protein kif14 [Clonorchis sinensis]
MDAPRAITVAARLRPFTPRELGLQDEVSIIQMPKPGVVLLLCKQQPDVYARQFIFDHTFWSFGKRTSSLDDPSTFIKPDSPPFADQATVYRTLAFPLLQRSLEGYNTCLFAYGVTSSGKTYSITGPPENPGIIPRLVDDLFREVGARQSAEVDYSVELSYFEIYNERIRDLLSSEKGGPNGLLVREHPVTGPYVEGLSRIGVRSSTDVLGWLRTGSRQRTVACTEFNEASSRSHTIFTLYLTRRTVANYPFGGMIESVYTSRINIVDLAGSERQEPGKNVDERLAESCQINKSLFTLGKVISQLSQNSNHPLRSDFCPASEPRPRRNGRPIAVEFATPSRAATPRRQGYVSYRDSVLTWLLKESLGGNSMTAILATISPSSLHFDQTLATLNYVKKAQSIVNSAMINEDPRGRVIRQLMTEVARLRAAAATKAEPGSPQAFELARLRELLILREREVIELSRALKEQTYQQFPKETRSASLRRSVERKPNVPPPSDVSHHFVDRSTSPIRNTIVDLSPSIASTPLRRPHSLCEDAEPLCMLNNSVQVQPNVRATHTQTTDVWICSADDYQELVTKTAQLRSKLDDVVEDKRKLKRCLDEAQFRNQMYEKIISKIVHSLTDRTIRMEELSKPVVLSPGPNSVKTDEAEITKD